jgi:hypothetical protein
MMRRISLASAVVLAVFNALSAVGGGIAILLTGGLGMPVSMLAGSPFSSFTWPAVILILVIGGSQAVAAALLIARRESALVASAVAGLGMLVWIFTETGIIAGISWLQILYFATGLAQVALVIALLGVVAWFPRRSLRPVLQPEQ